MKKHEYEKRILDRVRSYGANLSVAEGKLRIINPEKLPETAIEFVKRNKEELVDFLSGEADRDERRAIMEHDGGLTPAVAEYLNRLLYANAPEGVSKDDWSFWTSRACKIIDDHFNGGDDADAY